MTALFLPALLIAANGPMWAGLSAGAASTTDAPGQATTRPAARPAPVVVLQSDFQDEANNRGWQPFALQWTPNHKERFLGEFVTSTGPVRLDLDSLPPHAYIRVVFDLFILKSWDGNAMVGPGEVRVGPDLWDLSVEGGPALLHTSFALFTRDGGRQAFPDDFPYGDHPHRTGAIAGNSLGYEFERPMDAVYHLDLAFPHSGKTLKLLFQSPGPPQEAWDESWGLDNFHVEALAEAPGRELDDAALERLCAELGGEDAMAVHKAVWRLIGAGDRAIPPLRNALAPPPADRKRVSDLIGLLDNPNWGIREEATKALKRLGLPAVAQIREALKQPLPAETEVRLRYVLAPSDADDATHPDALRYARILRILDVINSPQAAELLATMATDGPTTAIRQAAKAARARIVGSMKKRT
jgi:hypothetical protein